MECHITLDADFDSYLLLPVLTQDGIIYSTINIGSFDGNAFMEYLGGILEEMNLYPGPRSILVLDNCAIYNIQGVEDLFTEQYLNFG